MKNERGGSLVTLSSLCSMEYSLAMFLIWLSASTDRTKQSIRTYEYI